jgi:hypothetical protein
MNKESTMTSFLCKTIKFQMSDNVESLKERFVENVQQKRPNPSSLCLMVTFYPWSLNSMTIEFFEQKFIHAHDGYLYKRFKLHLAHRFISPLENANQSLLLKLPQHSSNTFSKKTHEKLFKFRLHLRNFRKIIIGLLNFLIF